MGFPRKMLMVAVATAAPTTEALKLKKTSTSVMKKVAAHSVIPDAVAKYYQEKGVKQEDAQKRWNDMSPEQKVFVQEVAGLSGDCKKELETMTAKVMQEKKIPAKTEFDDFLTKCVSPENHELFKKAHKEGQDMLNNLNKKNQEQEKKQDAEQPSNSSC